MEFRTWISGKANKMTYVKTLLLALGILIFGIILAGFFYQLPFSFLTTQISDLGMRPTNPIGAWIFTFAFIIAGIIIVPHAFFFYRVLQPEAKKFSQISAGLIMISGIGLAGVGIFQAGLVDIEDDIVAICAFGGLGLSCLVSLIPIIKKIRAHAVWPKLWHIILFYGPFIVVLIVTAIFSFCSFNPTY